MCNEEKKTVLKWPCSELLVYGLLANVMHLLWYKIMMSSKTAVVSSLKTNDSDARYNGGISCDK